MSFYDEKKKWNSFDFSSYFSRVTEEDVLQSIEKEKLSEYDLLNLLSPTATKYLEKMAQKAHNLKLQHFGNVICLYIPIYVSNYCSNGCTYCGFSMKNKIHRRHMTLKEIEEEAKEIAKTKIEHIILLTGEVKDLSTLQYIKEGVSILKKYFASVSVEVMPLKIEEYATLKKVGLDGMTIYQETYNEEVYDKVHLYGKKKDYLFRLGTPERAAEAGLRTVGIGALFGLSNIREEAFFAGLHLQYLIHHYPNTTFGISLPRINPAEGGFQPDHPLDDIQFVQFLTAYRIFQPKADLSVSTREIPEFRDHLLALGVTRISAGSKTDVGGYTNQDASTAQFEISDSRSVEETVAAVERQGFQVIYKDWENLV